MIELEWELMRSRKRRVLDSDSDDLFSEPEQPEADHQTEHDRDESGSESEMSEIIPLQSKPSVTSLALAADNSGPTSGDRESESVMSSLKEIKEMLGDVVKKVGSNESAIKELQEKLAR